MLSKAANTSALPSVCLTTACPCLSGFAREASYAYHLSLSVWALEEKEADMAAGNVTIEIDDALLTIFLRMGLARAQAQAQLPFSIKQITATIDAGGVELVAGPARVTLQPALDAAGRIDLRITTAKMGALGLPGFLYGLLNSIINDRVNQLLSGLVMQGLRPRLLDVRTRGRALVVTAELAEIGTMDA